MGGYDSDRRSVLARGEQFPFKEKVLWLLVSATE